MSIFRSYDVRGVYGEDIDENIMERIGAAFSKFSTKTIAVANDMRLSSESLKRAFIRGSGKSVIDCGCVPLGVGMIHALNKYDYAYITASHLPKEWNGVKFFHKNGIGFNEEENKSIEKSFGTSRQSNKAVVKKENTGKLISYYKDYVLRRISVGNNIKVVLDCGNGMASVVVDQLFREAGFKTEVIFNRLDGNFPDRGPDPNENDLNELRKKCMSADIGIAYDGDGDRMVLVDNFGKKLTPEQTSYLILLDAVKNNGPIVANVECTRIIDDVARKSGKKIVRVPVGHTFLMQAVESHKACFGVEASGHYTLPCMAPIDDSLMASIYAAAVVSKSARPVSEIVNDIKIYPFGRVNFDCNDKEKFIAMEKIKNKLKIEYKKIMTLDGVRVDFPDGWVLIRASNTSPTIRLTVEGENKRVFERLKKKFSNIIKDEIKGRTF